MPTRNAAGDGDKPKPDRAQRKRTPRPIANSRLSDTEPHGRAFMAFLDWWIRGIEPTHFVAQKLADHIGWKDDDPLLSRLPWGEHPNPLLRRYLNRAIVEFGIEPNPGESAGDLADRLRHAAHPQLTPNQGHDVTKKMLQQHAGWKLLTNRNRAFCGSKLDSVSRAAMSLGIDTAIRSSS